MGTNFWALWKRPSWQGREAGRRGRLALRPWGPDHPWLCQHPSATPTGASFLLPWVTCVPSTWRTLKATANLTFAHSFSSPPVGLALLAPLTQQK